MSERSEIGARSDNGRESSGRPRSLLIVLLGAIGDVTRALPLAVRIKEHWPDITLGWAVEPASAGLLRGHPAVDRIHLFERPRGFTAFRAFLKELRNARYECTLDLQRHFKSGITSFASGAPRRIAFNPRNSRELNLFFNNEFIPPVEHLSAKIHHYQLFGDKLGLPARELSFGLHPSDDERAAVTRIVAESYGGSDAPPGRERRVGLIIGASWPSRLWNEERYAETITRIAAKYGLVSIMIGGPGERQSADRIASLLDPAVRRESLIDLVGKTSLRELAALFGEVRFAIGSDSGPMHIAAAMGTRLITLWGASSPLRSGPYGSGDLTLQSAIGCSPCYRKLCPGLNRLCMDSIPPAAVLARVEQVLGPPDISGQDHDRTRAP